MTASAPAQTSRRLVSVLVPVLNEEDNIDPLMKRLQQVAADNQKYDFEFVVTDNASTDNTFAKLAEHAVIEPRLRIFRFSRNFGFQRSILFNLLQSRGDAAVQIDADLQDPPELISTFLERWETGFKVVFGIRRKRKENFVLTLARKVHYRLLNALSEVEIPVDAGDFRLIDRVVIEHLRAFEDRSPYLRGTIASIGYPQSGVVYDRSERIAGRSKFNFFRLLSLSIDGICSQSTKPLQYITIFGFGVSLITVLMMIVYLLTYAYGFNDQARGFTTLVLLTLSSIGLNAAFIGLLGEYIGRIFNTVRGGPIAIVSDRIDPIISSPANPEHPRPI
jgi:dolichol-phosphate mannosyltransferase